jgi:hypothetical protein
MIISRDAVKRFPATEARRGSSAEYGINKAFTPSYSTTKGFLSEVMNRNGHNSGEGDSKAGIFNSTLLGSLPRLPLLGGLEKW